MSFTMGTCLAARGSPESCEVAVLTCKQPDESDETTPAVSPTSVIIETSIVPHCSLPSSYIPLGPRLPSASFRLPFVNADARMRMADLCQKVKESYCLLVKRNKWRVDDFIVNTKDWDSARVWSAGHDIMGVVSIAIIILRRMLPEHMLITETPYAACVLATAALITAYKSRLESVYFDHKYCSILTIWHLQGKDFNVYSSRSTIDFDVERAEFWVITHGQLFQSVFTGLYASFEFELSRYNTEGRLTTQELLVCLAAGSFFFQSAAVNPMSDVLEVMATHATAEQMAHGLALATIRALALVQPIDCRPDEYDRHVVWSAAVFVCNAEARRPYTQDAVSEKNHVVNRMTSYSTLHQLGKSLLM